MIKYNLSTFFDYLKIPETWNNLGDFIKWYMDSKMPFRIPPDVQLYRTDNASSIVIFRHNVFQVELYLNDPNSKVDFHGHPGINILSTMPMNSGNNQFWGFATKGLKDGEKHDADFSSDKGTIYLTFQHWAKGANMTSASVNWSGPTVGPAHDRLINSYFNGAVRDGVSYLTREMVLSTNSKS